MFELMDAYSQNAVIKVMGVGGGGGNAVQHMVEASIDGVEFICANTDAQALQNINARVALQLGSGMTKGLGAGANPDIGRQAATEDRERIMEVKPTGLHQRVPVILGSKNEVDRVVSYHKGA